MATGAFGLGVKPPWLAQFCFYKIIPARASAAVCNCVTFNLIRGRRGGKGIVSVLALLRTRL